MIIRTFKIWLSLCFVHLAVTCLLPLVQESWIIGIGAIYLTVLLIGKTGLPGVLNHAEGWGWPSPTAIGWSAGVFIWMLFYWFLSMAIARILTVRMEENVD